MRSHIADTDVLLRYAAKNGLETQAAIADAAGVSPRSVWNALKGAAVSGRTLRQLARAFGLGDDYSELIRSTSSCIASHDGRQAGLFDDTDGTSPFVNQVELIEHRRKQDIKVVLASRQICRSLLTRSHRPSLRACIEASVAFTPTDDRHKDYPFVPGSRYNHFCQPSAIVIFRHPAGDRLLAYPRKDVVGAPDYLHTQGTSILFAVDYFWGLHRRRGTIVDEWLELACRNGDEAARRFVSGDPPILLQLLKYKLDLTAVPCNVSPFGIISRDERRGSLKRAYTQYVFRIEVEVRSRIEPSTFVERIPAPGLALRLLPMVIDADKVFIDGRRKNAMDIVACEALQSDAHRLSFEDATFCRLFRVV